MQQWCDPADKNKAKTKNNWKLKISDMLVMKKNKVDKINPFHANMLLGQIIEIEETGYVRIIVTEYGKVNTLIRPSQLYPCTASNMKLDFSTKTSFTAACKKAIGPRKKDCWLVLSFPYTTYIENVLRWKNKTNNCYKTLISKYYFINLMTNSKIKL